MTADLFRAPAAAGDREPIGAQAVILRGFALPYVNELLPGLKVVEQVSPFRRMVTPGGFTMSVDLTNCGALGWTTDRRGYRYASADPLTGKPWPAMPRSFVRLARAAAAEAGFDHFEPDACLVNRYVPGSRLSLHRDKNLLHLDADPLPGVGDRQKAAGLNVDLVCGPGFDGQSLPICVSEEPVRCPCVAEVRDHLLGSARVVVVVNEARLDFAVLRLIRVEKRVGD